MPQRIVVHSLEQERLFIYYLKGVVRDSDLSDCTFFLGVWQEDELSFLFFTREARQVVYSLLRERPDLILIDEFEMSYQDWQGGQIRPFSLGRLCFVPVWETNVSQGNSVSTAPERDRQTIVFDPGVVFGAGNHQTTISCLEAMNCLLSRVDWPELVLDLGCGSGLLSLAAVGMGSKQVLAVDLNPLAVKTCKRNVELNGFQASVLSVQGRAEDFVLPRADLVLANIHYDILSKIIVQPAFGRIKTAVLSGLLRSQMRELRSLLAGLSVNLVEVWDDGVWFTCLCEMTM